MFDSGHSQPKDDWYNWCWRWPIKFRPQSKVDSGVSSIIVASNSVVSCNKVPIDLWHFRLGYPSHDGLHAMRQHYTILTIDKNFVCDTCHKAKQKKSVCFP